MKKSTTPTTPTAPSAFPLIERGEGFSILDFRFSDDQASASVPQRRGSAQSKIGNRQSKISRTWRGFTLIEILATLTIIGLLAALLFPIIGSTRQAARRARCVASIRQWAIATDLYAADNKNRLPRTRWDDSGNYAHYHLLCYLVPNHPADKTKQWDIIKSSGINCTGGGAWKYGFNEYISEKPRSAIDQPTRHLLATCSTGGWLGSGTIAGTTAYLQAIPKPHSGKVNLLYLDGSVRLSPVSAITYAEIRRGDSSYKASDETARLFGGSTRYDK
ncbi:MAG: prepilin-type N-terminal cleavage/methylation domain-containing protein [Opitutaceae bacterium]|jgi:prepilin-type N-terminal cleavage/methylation domain-containing protein/prepilin-type processing-associated H-X9-DG protein|nr:prepilin-type N-terminal cleavage/methylation domain-containing protein [Opitutaceae bacterium]